MQRGEWIARVMKALEGTQPSKGTPTSTERTESQQFATKAQDAKEEKSKPAGHM